MCCREEYLKIQLQLLKNQVNRSVPSTYMCKWKLLCYRPWQEGSNRSCLRCLSWHRLKQPAQPQPVETCLQRNAVLYNLPWSTSIIATFQILNTKPILKIYATKNIQMIFFYVTELQHLNPSQTEQKSDYTKP